MGEQNKEIGISEPASVIKLNELTLNIPLIVHNQPSQQETETALMALIQSGSLTCYHGTTTARTKLMDKSPLCVTFDPFHALQIALQRAYVEENLRKHRQRKTIIQPIVYLVKVDLRKLSVANSRIIDPWERQQHDTSFVLVPDKSGKWYIEEIKLQSNRAIKRSQRKVILNPKECQEILRWRKKTKPFELDILVK